MEKLNPSSLRNQLFDRRNALRSNLKIETVLMERVSEYPPDETEFQNECESFTLGIGAAVQDIWNDNAFYPLFDSELLDDSVYHRTLLVDFCMTQPRCSDEVTSEAIKIATRILAGESLLPLPLSIDENLVRNMLAYADGYICTAKHIMLTDISDLQHRFSST